MADNFSAAWLDLRAPFDAAARAGAGPRRLIGRFSEALGDPGRPVRVLDLGGGTGANLRILAPALPPRQAWTVVDRDAALLAGVVPHCRTWAAATGWSFERLANGVAMGRNGRRITVRTLLCDLAAGLGALDLPASDGVTAAALLDLVSAGWLRDLVGACAAAQLPALFALTINERLAWTPAHESDDLVTALFHRDMRREKGFGPALGDAAAPLAARLLREAGYDVEEARSDWCVGPHDGAMHRAVLDGIVAAARRVAPDAGPAIDAWAAARAAAVAAGSLRLDIGHVDQLALVPGSSPSC